MGDATRGSPIPLHGGIKAHALCEENAHLRHMQRLIRALQRVTILLLSRACLYPPPPRRPGFSLASAPPRGPKPFSAISPASAVVGSCSASELRSLRLLHLDDERPPALCVRSEGREIPPRPAPLPLPLGPGGSLF